MRQLSTTSGFAPRSRRASPRPMQRQPSGCRTTKHARVGRPSAQQCVVLPESAAAFRRKLVLKHADDDGDEAAITHIGVLDKIFACLTLPAR